jgi:hypothetical protein
VPSAWAIYSDDVRRATHITHIWPLGRTSLLQGAAKKKSDTPVVDGWVRGQKSNHVKFFPRNAFCGDFLESPCRETPKDAMKKKIEKKMALSFQGAGQKKRGPPWVGGWVG